MEALKIIKFKEHELKRNFINDLPYNPKLKEFARKLRKSRNLAEVLFWNEVKSKRFHSLGFDVKKNMMLVLQDLENFIINQYKL